MTTIALVGAGGKMGRRLTNNLRHTEYAMRYVEIGEAGVAELARIGVAPMPEEEALAGADVVILAVPDRALGKIARALVPKLAAGTLVMLLDPAAAAAGELPIREDIAYFVTHPCHPPVFNDETGEARRDFFGGVLAKQAIVCALMQGTEADYARAETIAIAMYGPVTRSHRITVEQMAILEPTMAETITAACITIIRETMDEAIRRGVPPDAARDFMLGHINIPLAIVFGEVGSPFSDGAKLIIEYGKERIFQPDWKRLFEPESVQEQVQVIVRGVSGA
ncbi:semialdehyde dehydrogenase [Capsulimonas corticalis]|uniref:Semialdehyde dehydrogenase n=1 Tax=Capsulimonas corticalis TaxID=2219043 RepID=A0A402CVQ6_9BACT|nr:phosphogluconate dehydrogenase C-terminal domain-containing protein [Capsulimonas corticalis]BDI30488.1 semialdehyde dehydrogenase [Capsulimonas corticalis]